MADIWFAGGCFWGTEKLFRSVEGVTFTEAGYANGDPSVEPTYDIVCRRQSGYRETVHVAYDPAAVSLDFLVYAFYRSIDPTLKDRQANDYGPQYQACIFWNDPDSEAIVKRISAIEAKRYKPFNVILEGLERFVPAEEYHQQYLEKNEHGYCHIEPELYETVSKRMFDPADYKRPSDEELKATLSKFNHWVTQEGGTEPPFMNEYCSEFREGIYVDRMTGEPLFLSRDKFDSGTGWPSFSACFDENAFVYLPAESRIGLVKEVRTRVGNTHLGHVFYADEKSPTGLRYCMDSASLAFIPLWEMEKKGYGRFKEYGKAPEE